MNRLTLLFPPSSLTVHVRLPATGPWASCPARGVLIVVRRRASPRMTPPSPCTWPPSWATRPAWPTSSARSTDLAQVSGLSFILNEFATNYYRSIIWAKTAQFLKQLRCLSVQRFSCDVEKLSAHCIKYSILWWPQYCLWWSPRRADIMGFIPLDECRALSAVYTI